MNAWSYSSGSCKLASSFVNSKLLKKKIKSKTTRAQDNFWQFINLSWYNGEVEEFGIQEIKPQPCELPCDFLSLRYIWIYVAIRSILEKLTFLFCFSANFSRCGRVSYVKAKRKIVTTFIRKSLQPWFSHLLNKKKGIRTLKLTFCNFERYQINLYCSIYREIN